jgi:hypothetical protein
MENHDKLKHIGHSEMLDSLSTAYRFSGFSTVLGLTRVVGVS